MTGRILVAGIGNVFFGDDGFGVEVAGLLARREWPAGVDVSDFGIRGYDLAFALLDGYRSAILLDATARGEAPGTLYVIDPELDTLPGPAVPDGHGLDFAGVLQLVGRLAAEGAAPSATEPAWIRIVGCEPDPRSLDADEPGLSAAVRAVLDDAVRLVEDIVRERMREERSRSDA
ncbi:MAG: hydrogenase maturation protease [Candidatus Binatota bacterium]|jgi:hydrogenase maturation protease|nr:hydrogenase maturation protease [Candidatus Binatota bacterium]